MKMLTFISAPYSHKDKDVMMARFEVVNIITANMLKRGELVISPLLHNIKIAEYGVDKSSKFWLNYSQEILMRCDRLLIIRLPEWYISKGLNAEINTARSIDIKVQYTDPPSDLLLKYKLR